MVGSNTYQSYPTMEMHYNHIILEERVKIETLRKEGYSVSEIAQRLGRHRSSIGRELERNFERAHVPYKARDAQRRKVKVRRDANASLCKLVPETLLANQVEEKLEQYWSPEQIAGRMKKENRKKSVLCHETIYQYVYKDRPDLIVYLRQGRKRRYRRRHGTKIRENRREEAKKKRIDTRPKVVEKRSRVGDWEGDTIVGKEKKVHLLTHAERKSGLVLIDKLPRATAKNARTITTKRFKRMPKKKRLTMTYDNGTTFAEHEMLERDLSMSVYFAYPYHSWERGTNENTNGLVRQFFPKGTAFQNLTTREIRKVEKLLNNRPRKRLGYATPLEVF